LEGVGLALDSRHVGFEVDADGGQVGGIELVLSEADEDGAFADCLGSHDDDFESLGFDILV